jgi:hypothetical protein
MLHHCRASLSFLAEVGKNVLDFFLRLNRLA